MSKQTGWIPETSVFPHQGIDSLTPENLLDARYASDLNNLSVKNGVMEKRKGYTLLGAQLGLGSFANPSVITDPIMYIGEFEALSGLKFLTCCTTRFQFRYSFGDEAWANITREGTNFSSSATVASAGNTVQADTTTDQTGLFQAGDFVRVEGSTADDGVYTVVSSVFSSPNTIVTVTETISGTESVTSIANVLPLTGTVDNVVDNVQGVDNNGRFLVLTNGLTQPVKWSGSGNFTLLDMSTYSGFVFAKSVNVFFDQLILANIQTASDEPQVVAWTNVAEFEEWTGGTSGVVLLSNAQGEILSTEILGNQLIVYARNSIESLTYVGGTAIFATEHLVSGIHVMSHRAVVNVGSFHVFLGLENFYLFDGSRRLVPIGDKMRQRLALDLDREYSDRAFTFHDSVRKLVYWGIPTGENSFTFYVWEYDLTNLSASQWSVFNFNDNVHSLGFFTNQNSLSWESNSVSGLSWDEMGTDWEEKSAGLNFPVFTLGAEGKPFLNEIAASDEGGVAITTVYESKDFSLPALFISNLGRFLSLEMELKGTQAVVYVSTDKGLTWTLAETLTLTSGYLTYETIIDVTGPQIRVKIQNTEVGGALSIRTLRVWVRDGGV